MGNRRMSRRNIEKDDMEQRYSGRREGKTEVGGAGN